MGNVFYAACQDPSVLNQFSVLANMKKLEQYRAENSAHHTQPKTDAAAMRASVMCACVHSHTIIYIVHAIVSCILVKNHGQNKQTKNHVKIHYNQMGTTAVKSSVIILTHQIEKLGANYSC